VGSVTNPYLEAKKRKESRRGGEQGTAMSYHRYDTTQRLTTKRDKGEKAGLAGLGGNIEQQMGGFSINQGWGGFVVFSLVPSPAGGGTADSKAGVGRSTGEWVPGRG